MNENAAAPEQGHSDRSTWLVGGVLGIVLVVVAVAAIVIVGAREDKEYAAGSPEAAFQAYVRAWDAGDTDAAWAMLTDEAQVRGSRSDFRAANSWRENQAQRIWIDQRQGTDERAVLHLTIESIHDEGLFGSGRDQDESRVTMVREDGDWKIATPLVGYYPW
jgi:hypothetical protein